MKNNNKLIKIIAIILFIVGLAAIGVGVFLSFNNEKEESNDVVYNALEKMSSYNSYKVYYKETYIDSDIEYETIINIDGEIEYFENSVSKYYNYNDKQIFSMEDDNEEEIWYYKPKNTISTNTDDFNIIFNNLFTTLKSSKIEKNNEVYKVINEELVDEEGDEYFIYDEIADYLSEIYYFSEVTYGNNSDHEVVCNEEIDDIQITIENDNVKTITFTVVENCEEETEIASDGKKLIFTFSDYDNTKVELPEEVTASLEKTTAGDWTGTYNSTKTCPVANGESTDSITDSITLTENFDWIDGLGWAVEFKLDNDCISDGYFSSDIFDIYYIEEDKVYVYNKFDEEILYEFNLKEDRLEQLDENGNVVDTFIKE